MTTEAKMPKLIPSRKQNDTNPASPHIWLSVNPRGATVPGSRANVLYGEINQTNRINEMNATTEICCQILADLKAMEPLHMPMLFAEFNQDDVYVYNASTKQLISQAGSSSELVRDASRFGYPVSAGQTWAKGMTAAHLGLWRKA